MIRDIKIFVDADEEVTFIVEKIENAPSPRVCIVVPDGAALLRSLVGLKLLRKNLVRTKKTGVVATMDREGKRLCELVGVKCVDRIGEITDEVWDEAEKLLKENQVLAKPQMDSQPDRTVAKAETIVTKENVIKDVDLSQDKVEEQDSESLMTRIEADNQGKRQEQATVVENPIESSQPKDAISEYKETPREETSGRQKAEEPVIEFEAGKELSPEEDSEESGRKEEAEIASRLHKRKIGSSLSAGALAASAAGAFAKAKGAAVLLLAKVKLRFAAGRKLGAVSTKAKTEQESGSGASSKDEFIVPGGRRTGNSVDLMRYQSSGRGGSHRRVVKTNWTPATLRRPASSSQASRFGGRRGTSSKGTGFLSGFFSKLSFSLPKGKLFYYICGGLLLMLTLFVLYLYFIAPSVKVVIYVEAQTIAENVAVTGAADVSAVDTANLKIPLTPHATTEEGGSSAMATGQGVIGEKARGSVSVINNTAAALTIADGTTITCISSACSGLKFKALGDVTIPPVDVDTVQVEADQVGANYNVSVSQSFQLGSYNPTTEVVIKNLSAFSGGTSENVVTVTKKDRTDLSASLKTSLIEACSSKLRSELGEGTIVIEKSLKSEVTAETFDKKEGDQAEIVNLTMSISCNALIYRRADIAQLASEIAQSNVFEGYSLDEGNNLTATETVLSVTATTAAFDVSISAKASPALDLPALKKALKGTNLTKADEFLSGLNNIQEYKIIYTPDWTPGFLKHMPGKEALINIDVELLSR